MIESLEMIVEVGFVARTADGQFLYDIHFEYQDTPTKLVQAPWLNRVLGNEFANTVAGAIEVIKEQL